MSMLNPKYGTIYRGYNIYNLKSYIGQTTQENPEDRWRQFYYDNSNFSREFQKDPSSFRFEVIKDLVPIEELDYWERYYIDEYDSVANGYNVAYGGTNRDFLQKNTVAKIELFLSYLARGFSPSVIKNLFKLNVTDAQLEKYARLRKKPYLMIRIKNRDAVAKKIDKIIDDKIVTKKLVASFLTNVKYLREAEKIRTA